MSSTKWLYSVTRIFVLLKKTTTVDRPGGGKWRRHLEENCLPELWIIRKKNSIRRFTSKHVRIRMGVTRSANH